MSNFYGEVSFTGRISFIIEAESKSKAKNIVFEDIEGLEIILKDGSRLEITEVNWNLISEASRSNVRQSHVGDFEVYEES